MLAYTSTFLTRWQLSPMIFFSTYRTALVHCSNYCSCSSFFLIRLQLVTTQLKLSSSLAKIAIMLFIYISSFSYSFLYHSFSGFFLSWQTSMDTSYLVKSCLRAISSQKWCLNRQMFSIFKTSVDDSLVSGLMINYWLFSFLFIRFIVVPEVLIKLFIHLI